MKAVGYIRVSTNEQAIEGASLDSQLKKIQAYTELKDLELIEVIKDKGLSAKDLNRDGIKQVIEMVKSNKVDAVVVFKLDRMFRSTVDALETARMFDKWEVALHSIQEALDTRSAMGKFFFTLTAALAEMEQRIISERTSIALQHKKAKNERVGHIPFGYQLAENKIHLIKNEQEQKILKSIRSLRRQGLSLQKIADKLNQRGKLNRRNRKWNKMSVKSVAKL